MPNIDSRPNASRTLAARLGQTVVVSLAASLLLAACTGGPPPGEVPAAPNLTCVNVGPATTPTQRCTIPGDRVVVEVPWQGFAVEVRSLGLGTPGSLVGAGGFAPVVHWPLLHLSVVRAANQAPVVTFDPPLEVVARYAADEFGRANPGIGAGQRDLGLAAWNAAAGGWTVLGHGVFHDGFWLADPIGGDGLVLRGLPAEGRPRFLMAGGPTGGTATALIAEMPFSLPLAWGSLPSDPDRIFKPFDGGCSTTTVPTFAVPVVECRAPAVGVTVRVPLQEGGSVTPKVIALPFNRADTFDADPGPSASSGPEGVLVRRLMNFLVVDAAEPTRVLFEFDPPMEFEVAYEAGDVDTAVNPVLAVNYWDEYVEAYVTLGSGATSACHANPVASVGCLWGDADAAEPTTDSAFFSTAPQYGYGGYAFFRADGGAGSGGVAKFTYDRWGDRMIMYVR